MLEAEVRGCKVLTVERLPPHKFMLTSPLARSPWEPRRPPEYRARYGIYLWSLPASLLDAYEYMLPMDVSDVIAMMRVVPSCAEQLELVPAITLARPNYIEFRGADVLYHRNMVAIARAVRIERLILHPEAPREVVTLCHQYGVPVHVSHCGAIAIGDGWVRVCSPTRYVALHTAHATVRLPGRTVSDMLEDEYMVALVRQAIEQAVAEIRAAPVGAGMAQCRDP
ncbi:MAG: hypothetical protein KatS3mg038_1820 [Candidatus Kapaibacterium sp.]|nr:MAG: hypothetical protein KatS3mg038_1820 [Candidatus Kapabacteria bacterium]